MSASMGATILRAPAKVNLTLEILARRQDGYHNLRSVMLPIALCDEIAIEPARMFSFDCEPATLRDANLVARALTQAGLGDAPLAVRLRKRTPVGAGLGGGSSDAAAILRAASEGTLGATGTRDWIADARALGSDVPFFLVGTGALVEGTGERVTALGALPPWWVVVVTPAVHVDTGDAYRRLAAERARNPAAVRPRSTSPSLRAVEALQRADYAAAIAAATNDFEPLIAAAYPPVQAALAALRAAGARHAMLSGSGGSSFALCPGEAQARALAEAVSVPPEATLFAVPLAAPSGWRSAEPASGPPPG